MPGHEGSTKVPAIISVGSMLSALARRRPTTLSRLSQQARSPRLLHCPVVPRTPPTTNPASRIRQLCSEPTPPPKGFGKFYKHKPGAAAEAETAGKDGSGKAPAASEGRAAEASEGAREGAKGEASGEGGGLGGGGGMHGGSGGGGESSGPGQPMMQAQAALSLALLWGLYQLSEGARGNAQVTTFPYSTSSAPTLTPALSLAPTLPRRRRSPSRTSGASCSSRARSTAS